MTEAENQLTPETARRLIENLIQERDNKIMADMQWVETNLNRNEDAAAARDRDAKIAQRNQVLYCIAHGENESFRYADIETLVRQRFPLSNQRVVMNVAHAISELAETESGILTHTPARDGYMLKSPVIRDCLRSMLRCKEDSEVVEITAGAV